MELNTFRYTDTNDVWCKSYDRISPPLESMSSCNLFIPHYESMPVSALSVPSPSPTSSSSSLSLLSDFQKGTSCFMLNQQFFNLQTELQTNNNYTTTLWTNQSASTGLNDIYISKQDVSVGTEPLTVKDFKQKNELQWYKKVKIPLNSLKSVECNHQKEVKYNYLTVAQMSKANIVSQNCNSSFKKQLESFKICEKLPPKKSRTKYTKEQIGHLEKAFEKNQYPDQSFIETLCKEINISKEKINIWFQNRRARHKRFKPAKNTGMIAVKPDNLDTNINLENDSKSCTDLGGETDSYLTSLDTETEQSLTFSYANNILFESQYVTSSPFFGTF